MKSVWIVILALLIAGEAGQLFFTVVEENFFNGLDGEMNWLFPVYDALGHLGHLSISMTTFCSIWVFASSGLLAACLITTLLHLQHKWWVRYILYCIVLSSALGFMLYRSHQLTYLHINDNSVTDMEMGWVGALVYLIPLTWATRRE